MDLRSYQADALAALESDWDSGLRRCGVSSATGTGKTVMMSHLAHRFVANNQRVLILVHRDELIAQTVDKLRRIDSTVTIGVVKAARNRASARIVVASVQTACRPKRLAQLGRFGLVICDEAHRSVSDQWLTVLNGLGCMSEGTDVRTAGFSATWTRADKRGLSMVWQKISFELSTEWAIGQGFLVRPKGFFIRTDVDLDKVKKTAGDYNAGDLGKKLSKESVRDAIVAGYLTHAYGRSGVVFAPTVESGEFFREGFVAAGISAEGLYGVTGVEESRMIHKRHKSGETQVLISCTRLSEGWDAPWCSVAVIARPTTHQGLFIQQIGRVLRPWEGKTDAVILDPTGVLFKHNLAGVVDLSASEPREPKDPDDNVDIEDEDAPPGAIESEGVRAFVSGYQMVDLFGRPHLRSHGGIPFSMVSTDRARAVIGPEQHPYPWFSVVEFNPRTEQDPQAVWLATQLPTEDEAMKWLPASDAYPHEALRRRYPNAKQRHYARSLGVSVRGRTVGEVYDEINCLLVGGLLDRVHSWS